MPHAIRISRPGGPEVLEWQSVDVGDPGPGQARIRQTAIGLNYIDTYQRSGLYKVPLPAVIGNEAAGVVEAVGAGVTDLKAGDHVAYSGVIGAYAEARVLSVDRLVKVPEGISDRMAATLMLKGLTVQYLLRQTYVVKAGDTILLHAAAGGIGLIACQWARALGATVDRHRWLRREGRTCEGQRLHAHHRLHAREFRRAGKGIDRRQGRAGGLRRRRQGNLSRVARLPVAARPVRQLWQRIGSHRSLRHTACFRRRARCT